MTIQHLHDEWAARSDRATSRRQLAELAALRPSLARFRSARALSDWFESSTDSADRNAVLSDLLSLAPDHNLAARAALQVMLPGLCALARRLAATDATLLGRARCWPTLRDAQNDVLAIAAEHITDGTLTQSRWPAMRLLERITDELQRMLRAQRQHRQLAANPTDLTTTASTPLAARSAAETVGELLDQAVADRLLRRDDARLIYEYHVLGETTEHSAARAGRPPAMVRQRRNRAVKTLASAFARGDLSLPRLDAA